MSLSSMSPLGEYFANSFESLEKFNTTSITQFIGCSEGQIPISDDLFCQNPKQIISNQDVFTDITGRTSNSMNNGELMRDYVRSNYSNHIEMALKNLFDNDDETIQTLQKKVDQVFPNEETQKKCLTEVIFSSIFDTSYERSSFATQNCQVENLEALSDLVSNSNFESLKNAVENKILNHMQESKYFKQVEEVIYPRIKNIFNTTILTRIEDPERKAAAMQLLDQIEFDYDHCNENYGLNKGQALFSSMNNPKICLSAQFLFSSTSLFQIVHTIAHELGHAFDECSNFCNTHGQWSRTPVIKNELGIKDVEGRCNRVASEAIADSFATQVQYEFFKNSGYTQNELRGGFLSTFFNLIEDNDLLSTETINYNERHTHPSTADRYDLLFKHSGIQQLTGCSVSQEETKLYE